MTKNLKEYHFPPESNLPYGDLFVKAISKKEAQEFFKAYISRRVTLKETKEIHPTYAIRRGIVVEEH